jgi:hypothetical protein
MWTPIVRARIRLLPPRFRADTCPVEKFVAVVICVLFVVPGSGASASSRGDGLLRAASHRSGLSVRRDVPEQRLRGARYDAALQRALNRDYPRSLQAAESALYAQLGLTSECGGHTPRASTSSVWYDADARRLLLRQTPAPARARVINELVRALVDQHFNLRRLVGLRARDRDRALAAEGMVDGTAALASGVVAPAIRGTPLERFLRLYSGLGAGRSLAKELRYLGGSRALASALDTFPQTTEQLLHVDKFLERERALPVRLPREVGDLKLRTSETFGELDVRSLLRTFGVPDAGGVAAGWGGGRLALYGSAHGETSAVLALRWDSYDDGVEWRDALPRYVAAAFPSALVRDCPPLDHCWGDPAGLAGVTIGGMSVFATGPASDALAGAALDLN